MPLTTVNHLEIDFREQPIKVLMNGEEYPLSNVVEIDIHLALDEKTIDIDKTEKYFLDCPK